MFTFWHLVIPLRKNNLLPTNIVLFIFGYKSTWLFLIILILFQHVRLSYSIGLCYEKIRWYLDVCFGRFCDLASRMPPVTIAGVYIFYEKIEKCTTSCRVCDCVWINRYKPPRNLTHDDKQAHADLVSGILKKTRNINNPPCM